MPIIPTKIMTSGPGAIAAWKENKFIGEAEEPTTMLRWNTTSGMLEQMWLVGKDRAISREWRELKRVAVYPDGKVIELN